MQVIYFFEFLKGLHQIKELDQGSIMLVFIFFTLVKILCLSDTLNRCNYLIFCVGNGKKLALVFLRTCL